MVLFAIDVAAVAVAVAAAGDVGVAVGTGDDNTAGWLGVDADD